MTVLGESFRTELAFIRSLPSVYALMSLQVYRRSKSFLTERTLVRTFTGVCTLVFRNLIPVLELFTADLAFVGFLARMCTNVRQ